jgi:hypothetical protein
METIEEYILTREEQDRNRSSKETDGCPHTYPPMSVDFHIEEAWYWEVSRYCKL